MAEFDKLRGQLERRLPARELLSLVVDSLGLPTPNVPQDAPAGAVVRAAVLHCEAHAALPALLEAVAHHLAEPAPDADAFSALRAEQALTPGEHYAGYQVLEVLRTALPVGQTYLVARDGQRGHLTRLRRTRPEDAERWLYRQRRLSTLINGLLESDDPNANEDLLRLIAPLEVGRAEDGRPFAYRPYVPGESLHDALLERGPLRLADAEHVCREVAKTLLALRQHHLGHGALDPRGVLRASDGDICLLGAGFDALREPGLPSHPDNVGVLVLFDGLTRQNDATDYGQRRPDASGALGMLIDAALARGEAPPLERIVAEISAALSGAARAELDEVAYAVAAEAFEESPSDSRAAALERIVTPARAFEVFLETVGGAVARAPTEERVRLHQRMGRVAFSELGDDVAGLASYRAALELMPDAEAARAGLENILRSRGDYEALSEALIEKAELTHDPQLRARVLREVARLTEDKLADTDAAFSLWLEALHDDPRDDSAARAIERLAANDDARWNTALNHLSESASESNEPAMAPLWVRLGRWYAHKLDRPDFALPCFSQAVTVDPAHDPAYEETIALYRGAESHRELVEVLERRADAHPNPARARDFRVEAAEVYRTTVGDPDAALRLLRTVLSDDPAHGAALSVLGSILTTRDGYAELADAVAAAIEHAHGPAQAPLYNQLAELREDHLGDADGAIDGYRAAIAADPRSVAAHKGLERLLAREGRYEELLEGLYAQERIASTPRQRVALFEHIGGLQEEEFVDPEAAIAAYERVVEIDAGHEGANPALARLYRQRGDDASLARTLMRHAKATKDAPRRHALLLQAASVYVDGLAQPERAIALCDEIVADVGDNAHDADALSMVARLRAQRGDATAAVAAVERLAESCAEPNDEAGHWTHAAVLLEGAGDNDAAIARYRKAQEASPGHRESAGALRRLYAGRGDHRAAAAVYRAELETVSGGSRRAELLAGLGALLAGPLDAQDEARRVFSEALELDEASVPAARGLADLMWERDEREGAAEHYLAVLDRVAANAVVQRGGPSDAGAQTSGDARPSDDAIPEGDIARSAERAGRGFLAAGEATKARRALRHGLEHGAESEADALREQLAEASLLAGDAAAARELYEALLNADPQASDEPPVHLLLGAARAATQCDEQAAAQKYLEQAAEVGRGTAGGQQALTELEALHREAERWPEVARTIERRIEQAQEGDRGGLYARLGEVRQGHLEDLTGAADAYMAALADSGGGDRNVLHKLMAVYTEGRDWSKLVEVLGQIAEQVNDPTQRGKYLLTAGTIAQDELGHVEQAIEAYGKALVELPDSATAHERLVRLLTESERWKPLKTEYARRLPHADKKEQVEILLRVGELDLRHLDDYAGAISVLEEAQRAAPKRRDVLEHLANAYASGPTPLKAAPLHRKLLGGDPFRVESYRALRAAYSHAQEHDPTFMLCSILNTVGAASGDEEAFYRKHRATAAAVARACVTPALFDRHVRHATQDLQLTAIVARIEPAMWIGRRRTHADYGLSASDRRDPAREQAVVARTLHYAAGVFSIPAPDVYLRPHEPGGLSTLLLDRPSVGLGEAALAGGPEQALAFLCARQVALLRPGHGVREVASSAGDLKSWVLAAIALSVPGFPAPENLKQRVERRRQALEAFLDTAQREDLAQQVKLLLEAAPQLDLKRYLAAVELGADRMGLILANDVMVAKKLIEASPEETLPRRQRIGELLRYVASEDYLTLRRLLGIAID